MTIHIILTIREGKRAGERHEFEARGEYAIGRAEDCPVRLSGDEPEYLMVSRRHCLVEFDPPQVRVRDLGSRNGTHLNGMQIGRPQHWHFPAEYLDAPCHPYVLRSGDELQVGPTVFEVEVCDRQRDDTAGPEQSSDVYASLNKGAPDATRAACRNGVVTGVNNR